MDVLLSDLIERAHDCVRSLEHRPSTDYQYQLAWQALADYFQKHEQTLFSRPLAEQYLRESKAKLEAGLIKRWRYKLDRRTVHLLIECFETGQIVWKYYDDPPVYLHQPAYLRLHADFLHHLHAEGKGVGTLQTHRLVSRQFLDYLEQQGMQEIAQAGRKEVSAFVPFISKHYQSSSMGTVLSALRDFLRYVEARDLTPVPLSGAVPASNGRSHRVVPALTPDEEQSLLAAADRTTASGKRDYAMLLLALRLGLRSSDIIHLKREDLHWQTNTLELVQTKTGVRLVLPLLTEVGNALADYLLHSRPASPLPDVFLRGQAPYRPLSGHANCYGISHKLMAQAQIRQGQGARQGFHCLRHTVAARLLAGGTPLPLISSLLGHQDKNSTQVYLSTDREHLRACALPLLGIEVTQEELP